ncbi:hypothetical protein CLV68_3636 [Actinokineospora cianjurensis]|uniref:Uncharacterized protein n=1 Tax=Actinokineospora cianjurensis TaxID=585224 RepID=A0A421B409_9PSEU|nr:hypothetical protein CLV68_3636 [Actinokineospora cianjurensis]
MTPKTSPADAPDPAHCRPAGVDDATVEAVGKLTEALETIERARGHLYSFHQLTGGADFELGEAADLLEKAGHAEIARRLRTELVGRNVLPGRWTFQIVEEYDEDYYERVRAEERSVRDELLQGRRHVYESELKESRRTRGAEGHEARP